MFLYGLFQKMFNVSSEYSFNNPEISVQMIQKPTKY